MINKQCVELGKAKSIIREIAAFGAMRKPIVGEENVLDFSIGNPSVPAPKEVQDAIVEIIQNNSPVVYHSYSAGAGRDLCRTAVAEDLNKRFGTDYTKDNVFMTNGASTALNAIIKTIIAEEGQEIVIMAPFFPEYTMHIKAQGGVPVIVPVNDKMTINLDGVKEAITSKTQGIIVNSPNNPSGVIYSKEELEALCDILREKEKEYGHPIYIISDEPYREIVLSDELEVPFIPNMYDNTIVAYSWSKSLSLPGERIGYILVPNKVSDKDFFAAVAGAARSIGHVCAPTLFQMVIEKCIGVEPDLEVYKKNRDLLYNSLTDLGYTVAKPDGAFYLFIEAPNKNAMEFAEKAKEYDLLLVPGGGFGSDAYLRLSYCVEPEKCQKAIPVFEKLIAEYK